VDPIPRRAVTLYPEDPEVRRRIDDVNAMTYPDVNNAVYRAGFATTQRAYDTATADLARGLQQVGRMMMMMMMMMMIMMMMMMTTVMMMMTMMMIKSMIIMMTIMFTCTRM
jgi:glutathionyl-hydroquinone reductase